MESSWRLLLVVVVFVGVMCQDNDCIFAPAAQIEGESTTLTCRFPMDVKKNTKNFFVQKSNVSDFKVDENVIVDCVWPKESTGPSPLCKVSKGYAEPIIDGLTVTIEILNANKEQSGHYKCLVVNPDSTPKSCSFSVAESSRSDSGAISTEAIIGISVGCAVGVGIIVAVAVAVYWKWKSWKGQRSQRVPTSERELNQINLGNVTNTGIVSRHKAECEERDRQASESMHAN